MNNSLILLNSKTVASAAWLGTNKENVGFVAKDTYFRCYIDYFFVLWCRRQESDALLHLEWQGCPVCANMYTVIKSHLVGKRETPIGHTQPQGHVIAGNDRGCFILISISYRYKNTWHWIDLLVGRQRTVNTSSSSWDLALAQNCMAQW